MIQKLPEAITFKRICELRRIQKILDPVRLAWIIHFDLTETIAG